MAIQLALDYTKQALAAPPESRDALWTKAESACDEFLERWPNNPRRVLVEVQLALASLARGEQARRSSDAAQAIEHLRVAARRFNDVAEAVDANLIELRLRRQVDRPTDALSVAELESLQGNVSFQLARTQHQLGLCYASNSPDRDDALLQAVKRLTPLSQRTPPDDLTWNARAELAACLRALGQTDSAERLLAAWLRENPPTDIVKRLSGEPGTAAQRANQENGGAPVASAEHLYRSGQAGEALAEYDRAVEQSIARGQLDEAFRAAMTAAAIERNAGRLAAAAERYRRLALRFPTHDRASEAHQLAVLCTADLLRQSPPAERAALAESYEGLLKEHLTQWPAHASADKIRLWLGQLLAARRDWSAAINVLQQVEPTSIDSSEAVQLLVQCYEERLRHVDGGGENEAPRREQLLAAASSYLQPIITGPDNRWPDPWSKLQRQTALALARLHLRFSTQGSPYAERLLTAALRGSKAEPEPEEVRAWEAAASALLVEALARNGKTVEARTTVDQLADAPVGALLETLAAIDGVLTRESRKDDDDRELGELALSLLRLVDAHRSELDATATARLGVWRAAALAAAGNRAAALAQYAALAAQSPDNGEIQERYAALLALSDSPPELRQALARWQEVESHSRRGGPRWRRARRARIKLLTRLGERTEAEKLVRLTQLLYPDWDQDAAR